jgi:hypothetical protein
MRRVRCGRSISRRGGFVHRWLSGFGVLALVAVCVGAGAASGTRKPPPFAQVGNYRPASVMQLRDTRALADNKVGTLFGG